MRNREEEEGKAREGNVKEVSSRLVAVSRRVEERKSKEGVKKGSREGISITRVGM